MEREREREHDPSAADEPGDYGYDLAHEVRPGGVAPTPASPRLEDAVHVATQTTDDGQDLSYDLAHDVPQIRGEQRRGE